MSGWIRTAISTAPRGDVTRTRSPSHHPEAIGVDRVDVQGVAVADGRVEAAGLHAGVEGVERPGPW